MPAFGAFTGGLNIRNAAFLKVFGALGFTAHLIGQRRLYSFAAARCSSGLRAAFALAGRILETPSASRG